MSTKSSLPDLRLGWLATSALMAALAAPLAARAQAAPDQPATVGEVIVTAQKRSESVKEVPNAVAVVSTQTLVDSGITEVRDLNGVVPGLQVTGGLGSGEVVIRGVTAGNDVGGTTAVVIDGVVVGPEDETAGGDNYIPQFDPSMISRLEVLKGPQGTLYGGSTLGGLLIYDTKKPTLTKPYGGFYVEGSETEHGGGNYILRGNVSAPIIQDKLGFSLSANDQDLTGYIKDPERGDKGYDSHRNIGVRGALLWQVSPDFQVQVSDLYTRQRSFTDQIIVTPTTPVSSLTYNSGILPSYNNEYNLAAINATYDLHWATLTYTGAYQTGTGSIALSYANTPTQAIYQFYLPLFGGTVLPANAELGVPEISSFDKYSSELRLSSPDTGKFRWIAGVYYVNETDKIYEDLGDFNLATQTNAAGPAGSLAIFELQSKLQQVAEYGDVTYYIFPILT